MEGVRIIEMGLEHVDEVAEIERLSFSTPWSKESLEMEVLKNKCARYIVAVKDNRVLGFAGMWLIIDEGHITNIAVHPDFRGQGIGNMLVEALIEECRRNGIHYLTLEVRRSNQVAINLYKKYGFEIYGIRKNYYQDTMEDAFIMSREVNID